MTDRAFEILERCAEKNERCPVTSGPDAHKELKSADVGRLAKAGKIFVEISSKNWRRVTILSGPQTGKSTAANPYKGSRVYQTIGAEGTKVNGRFVDHGASSR